MHRYVIFALAVAPPTGLLLALYYAPQLIIGRDALDASMAWSLVGVALSYLGLLFSAFAAFEVEALSRKYFFKLRSPEIHKQLKKISGAVSVFGSEPAAELRAQSFLHETPAILRAAKRFKNGDVRRIIKEADLALKKLIHQAEVNALANTAGEVHGYWAFYQKISELADEVSIQIDDVRASA